MLNLLRKSAARKEFAAQLEAQLAELQATLAEVSEHEKEARSLLARQQPRPASKTKV